MQPVLSLPKALYKQDMLLMPLVQTEKAHEPFQHIFWPAPWKPHVGPAQKFKRCISWERMPQQATYRSISWGDFRVKKRCPTWAIFGKHFSVYVLLSVLMLQSTRGWFLESSWKPRDTADQKYQWRKPKPYGGLRSRGECECQWEGEARGVSTWNDRQCATGCIVEGEARKVHFSLVAL